MTPSLRETQHPFRLTACFPVAIDNLTRHLVATMVSFQRQQLSVEESTLIYISIQGRIGLFDVEISD